ncbi:MAG: aspartate kinase, partial [Deltaproteobacteria bacterium]|nr:aspartate kinase [Deltaproteobacteria bacterium]
MRVVVKFGGTSVKDLERVKTAARNLVKLKNSGTEIAVVVSAPGKMTNKLIQKGAIFSRNGLFSQDYLNLLSLGEKQSTYLMSMALNSLNVQSRSFTLDSPEWPLISEPSLNSEVAMSSGKENDLIDIRIDEEETTGRFRKFIEPVLRDGQIPVISGFFIRDASGKIVTLGRGGSDITAFLVGKYLKADEVIIVTDVSGVYSGE